MHYISNKFCKIILNVIKVQSRHDFITENYKGNNSAKYVGGVTMVNLCKSSSHALYLCQVL